MRKESPDPISPQIKDVGGVWNPGKQAREVRYDRAVALGLTAQIKDEGC